MDETSDCSEGNNTTMFPVAKVVTLYETFKRALTSLRKIPVDSIESMVHGTISDRSHATDQSNCMQLQSKVRTVYSSRERN